MKNCNTGNLGDHHLFFLESLDKVDRAISKAETLDQMMGDVLDTALVIFNSDRAWLLYPCDPVAPSWSVPMERTRKEWPGALAGGKNIPMLPEAAEAFRAALESDSPVVYDPESGRPVPPHAAAQFTIRSQITVSIHPKLGSPWLFGMHQCSHARIWNRDEQKLFHEIGRRVADALSTLLLLRDLRRNETKYRALVESSTDFIWEVDGNGFFVYASPMVKKILGYDPGEVIGRTPFDFMPQEEAARVQKIFADTVAGKKPIEALVNVNLHRNGDLVTLETSATPVFDDSGEIAGYRGIDRDITKRRKAEEALRKSEERLRTVIDATPFPVAVADRRDNSIVFWSHSALALFGHNVSTVAEWYEKAYPDPIYRSEVIESWRPYLETPDESNHPVNTGEYRITCGNGSARICEIYATFLPDYLIVTFNDITERKKAATALQESEERFRTFYETAPLAFVVWDTDCRITEWNDRARKMFGWERSEVLGRSFYDLIVPAEERQPIEQIVQNILNGTVDKNVINQNITRDGRVIWCEWSNAILHEPGGGVRAVLSLGLDVTDRITAEKELEKHHRQLENLVRERTIALEEKNRELETFTYSVSHDLKAPLRGIDGYSRLLLEEYGDRLDDEGRLFLENVRRSTEQMNQLIEDLLAYSRMERRDIQPVPIDLPALIEMLFHEREQDVADRQVELTSDIPFETMICDRESIRQILGNLLDNAVKFTRDLPVTRIAIRGEESPDAWILSVRDNGVGFDPQYRERIFGIFQRLHRAEDYPGTGVGLAIVKKAINRMGGLIQAESEPGKGAVFHVHIPKAKQPSDSKGQTNGQHS